MRTWTRGKQDAAKYFGSFLAPPTWWLYGLVILTTVLLFLSPIFFPSAAVPPQFRFLIRLNPLTFLVEQARAVLTFHSRPDFPWLAVVTVQNLLCAALAFWWFQKARRGFGDVI